MSFSFVNWFFPISLFGLCSTIVPFFFLFSGGVGWGVGVGGGGGRVGAKCSARAIFSNALPKFHKK